jgi:hypothetical protein
MTFIFRSSLDIQEFVLHMITFENYGRLLTNTLMLPVLLQFCLMSPFCKVYCCYNNLVYQRPVQQSERSRLFACARFWTIQRTLPFRGERTRTMVSARSAEQVSVQLKWCVTCFIQLLSPSRLIDFDCRLPRLHYLERGHTAVVTVWQGMRNPLETWRNLSLYEYMFSRLHISYLHSFKQKFHVLNVQ